MTPNPVRKMTDYVLAVEAGNYSAALPGLEGEWRDLESALYQLTQELQILRELRQENGALQRELRLSRAIQDSLLPHHLPDRRDLEFAAFYRPAQDISGDYYDVIEIDESHVGLAVADVAGKSLSGGMFMAVTQSALRAQAKMSLSPREVLEWTERSLSPSMKPGFFVSIFYAVLDLQALTLTCANAGHLPLAWYRKNQAACEWVHPKGVAIGLRSYTRQGVDYEEKTITLSPGDLAFLFTDGVSEAMGGDGQLFTRERVARLIRESGAGGASRFLECLEKDLLGYLVDEFPRDDMAGIVIGRKTGECHG